MQENPSRTLPVIVGFTLCLLVIGVIAFFAFYAITDGNTTSLRLCDENSMFTWLVRSSRHFDAAQIAMLQFRETNDTTFKELTTERLLYAHNDAGGAQYLSYSKNIKEQAGRLMDLYKDFQTHFETDVRIGEELEQLEMNKIAEVEQLLDQQQDVRQRLGVIANEIARINEELLETSGERLEKFNGKVMERMFDLLVKVILATAVSVVVVIAVCVVVVRKVNR